MTSSLRPPLGSPVPSPADIPASYRSGSHRVLKSQSGGQSAAPRHLEHASLRDANIVSPNSTGFQPSTPERRPYSGLAVAYLNMDLIVAKASSNFIDAVSPGVRELVGKNLFDMIGTADREKLYRLKRQLQEERDSREPAYLPPIYGESEIQAIQGVHESEIASVTSGSHDRTEDLTFRLPDGRHNRIQVQLKLAKTSVFFAVLVLPTLSYPPELRQLTPQGGQYRQSAVQPVYGQTIPLSSYGQPSHAQPYPSGPPDGSSPYYNQRSLVPIGSPSGDPRSQVQLDPGYCPMAKYPSTSLAPSHTIEPRTTPTSGTTSQQPLTLYGSTCEGPPRSLQLPPLRGVTGPDDTQTTDVNVGRDVGNSDQSEQQGGGRKNKRDRIAVQEMLG
ncbi:hypothetical protein GP486_005685 [Trichoglossum hirsutum]|uniref:PAS domain-containing protein n=1 Tax=Trichoglossum hirsutum TaxID=265104 RepID=A0A9P8RM62_9PEZI|nr:hypothetical protein GP486_005685 [Trichoglossum hirsutum]